jgi:hypothetical protein
MTVRTDLTVLPFLETVESTISTKTVATALFIRLWKSTPSLQTLLSQFTAKKRARSVFLGASGKTETYHHDALILIFMLAFGNLCTANYPALTRSAVSKII